MISGNFTFQEATDLSLLLRSGALPTPLIVVEERTVGPDLGEDSIKSGITSLIVGFILVILFMLYKYKIFGLIANTALIANLLMLTGVLTILEATLTLPGIAGIILTVGMAVDANVLLFPDLTAFVTDLTSDIMFAVLTIFLKNEAIYNIPNVSLRKLPCGKYIFVPVVISYTGSLITFILRCAKTHHSFVEP